jgi:rfaE bifunctional protein kinase chain/domain/rfaE bifunctional protein nucleotidyltransferase chain/domain
MTPDPRVVHRVLDAVRARTPRVVVVGDVILDRWSVGEAERVSREAPAPVVRVTESVDLPGGAANTAANLASLGAEVSIVATVGDDASGSALRTLLAAAGVDTSALVIEPGGRTTTKARIIGGDRMLVRVDEIAPAPGAEARAALTESVRTTLQRADAVVVCDYELGLDPGDVVDAVLARRPEVVVVDAHDLRRWAPIAPDLVTPNHQEASRLLGAALGDGSSRAQVVTEHAEALRTASNARSVVVTLDREGALGLQPDGGVPVRTRAVRASEQQASGAGDTFCAAAALALTVGAPLADVVRFGQAAADVVVQEPGTSVCTADALRAASDGPAASVVDHEDLVAAVAAARAAGRRIVFTNGCFDVVHRGHTTYLGQARALGDLLVVAVNDDDSVRRLKGAERPINPAEDRAGVLAALSSVDYVTVFATDTPIPLIERLQPDVYVKGGDYSPDMLAEAPVVRAYGGEVVMVDYVAEHSTSDVVRRIRAAARP